MTRIEPKTLYRAAIGVLIFIVAPSIVACFDKPVDTIEELFERDSIPAPRDDLIVFIGRKISVEEFEPEVDDGYVLMDLAFLARYDVVSVLRGEYARVEIEFEAYDHYGFPSFASYETVVLFVSPTDDGTYYHQKYQYIPVYPTADGAWAGCGDPYAREPDVHRGNVEAHDIQFDPPVVFDTRGLTQREVRERFPGAYFRRSSTRAECVKGNSLDELLRVKFDGVMGSRGYSGS